MNPLALHGLIAHRIDMQLAVDAVRNGRRP
jgi:hypothetical protein